MRWLWGLVFLVGCEMPIKITKEDYHETSHWDKEKGIVKSWNWEVEWEKE